MNTNQKLNVAFILGTRPEAIKLAPVIIKFKENKNFKVNIILSGQHEEMIRQVMEDFQIKPDFDFKVLKKSNSIDEMLTNIINKLGQLFKEFIPNIIFVQGDTTTALAGALAGFFHKIPIAHIEAGLRTNSFHSPFPEEANRRIISQISSLHFAPTKLALNNLINSGIKENIFLTGNTVVDALFISLKRKRKILIKGLDITNEEYILVTVHRRENWGSSIKDICLTILELRDKYKDIKFVLPLHKNPLVKEPFKNILGNKKNIFLIESVPYLDFVNLIKNSKLVLTDSGGIQEEAAILGKPTIILRDETERPEVLNNGNACLVGNDPKKIKHAVNSILFEEEKYLLMSKRNKNFGDGLSSEKIILETIKFLSKVNFDN